MSESRPSTEQHWNAIYLLSAAAALVSALAVGIQPLLLDKVFGIAFEKEGSINADIQVVAEIISILCVGYFGLLSDRIGRVPVVVYAFCIIAVGAALSLISIEIGLTIGVGGLIVFYVTRVLISVGAETAQLQLSTLVGDNSDYHNRPRLLTNIVFMMVFGGTVLSGIIMQLTEHPSGILVVMTIPLLIGVVGIPLARRGLRDVAPKHDGDHLPFTDVWTFVTRDPRMQLAFAAAFYTRADIIIVSLFYSLWCISFSDVVGVTRTFATAHAAGMIALLGVGVLASIPLWRAFIERHSRISAIGAALSVSATGYMLLGMTVNPFSWGVAIPLLLIGIGHAGCWVTLKVLVIDVSPKEILGTLLGAAYLTGGAGIIMLVQSSGYYFDAVGPRAPFLLMGTGKFLVMLYAGWLLWSDIDETADHVLTSARKIDWKPLVFLTSALPFVWLVGRALVEGYAFGTPLGQIPVGFINRYLGDWAFTFLLISLALRPVQELTGLKALSKYRRMIGLYAFFYACLHVATYISMEWAFKLGDMVADIYKRPFILLGLCGFLLLIPLAMTSNDKMVRKVGGKKWKLIHRSAYALNILVAFHFILAANAENGEPYVYAVAVAVLLGYRARQAWKRRRLAE
jgi:DMSO/TMAO reductase YedYZ heme-binding membrane subunit